MITTPKLGLKKYEPTDSWALQDQNDNMDALDKVVNDFEYATATIVGTQIRVIKTGPTANLRFRLTTAIAGGAITISIDNGATSKPLKDIDGENVTELDKGFYEVIADATFFTLRPSGGGGKGDFLASLQSTPYIINVNNLCATSTDIYYSFDIFKLGRVSQATMRQERGNSLAYSNGETINAVVVDDFVYIGGNTLRRIRAFTKDMLVLEKESAPLPANIRHLLIDSDHIYAFTDSSIIKLRKSDLEIVGTAAVGGGWKGAVDDAFIYVGQSTVNTIVKINKDDMSTASVSAGFSDTPRSIQLDNGSLYARMGTKGVSKFNKDTLTLISSSPNTVQSNPGTEFAIADNYVYIDGFYTVTNRRAVHAIDKQTMQVYLEGPVGYGRTITTDGTHVFVVDINGYHNSTQQLAIHKMKIVKG